MKETDQITANSQIGACIKRARSDKNFTLSELASRCDLSESFLSKIERGVTAASIANLLQICSSLNIEIVTLFDGLGMSPTRTHVTVHRRTDSDFSFIPSTGYSWRRLGGGNRKDEMEIFHLILPRNDKMETLAAHLGQEHCFVISGEVIFDVGDESHHLLPGDGIYIDSTQPHRARSTGNKEAHILMAVAAADGTHPEFDWWRPASTIEGDENSNMFNGG